MICCQLRKPIAIGQIIENIFSSLDVFCELFFGSGMKNRPQILFRRLEHRSDSSSSKATFNCCTQCLCFWLVVLGARSWNNEVLFDIICRLRYLPIYSKSSIQLNRLDLPSHVFRVYMQKYSLLNDWESEIVSFVLFQGDSHSIHGLRQFLIDWILWRFNFELKKYSLLVSLALVSSNSWINYFWCLSCVQVNVSNSFGSSAVWAQIKIFFFHVS